MTEPAPKCRQASPWAQGNRVLLKSERTAGTEEHGSAWVWRAAAGFQPREWARETRCHLWGTSAPTESRGGLSLAV